MNSDEFPLSSALFQSSFQQVTVYQEACHYFRPHEGHFPVFILLCGLNTLWIQCLFNQTNHWALHLCFIFRIKLKNSKLFTRAKVFHVLTPLYLYSLLFSSPPLSVSHCLQPTDCHFVFSLNTTSILLSRNICFFLCTGWSSPRSSPDKLFLIITIHSFIHLYNEHLLSLKYVPDIVLGTGNATENKTNPLS